VWPLTQRSFVQHVTCISCFSRACYMSYHLIRPWFASYFMIQICMAFLNSKISIRDYLSVISALCLHVGSYLYNCYSRFVAVVKESFHRNGVLKIYVHNGKLVFRRCVVPITMAAWFRAWVLTTCILGSNPSQVMDVCIRLLVLCCPV
jgi:hypothetical protein